MTAQVGVQGSYSSYGTIAEEQLNKCQEKELTEGQQMTISLNKEKPCEFHSPQIKTQVRYKFDLLLLQS